MNKTSAIFVAVVMTAAVLGCVWVYYLSELCSGRGIVNMNANTMIFDLVVVGILSLVGFALNTNYALWALGGWLGGQLLLLIWDGMPRGRSLHMFQPTNFLEALFLGLLVVVVLNWSVLLGGLLGWLVRHLLKRNSMTQKFPK